MKVSEKYEQLIARYLNGECNGTEKADLHRWLETSEENRKLFFGVKDAWDAAAAVDKQTEVALLQFYKKAASKNGAAQSVKMWKRISSVAAVLVFGLLSFFAFHMLKQHQSDLLTLNVPMGSKSELVLADGTRVVLNAGSKLTYPGVFETEHREITLEGEAFFEVSANKLHPFIVNTSDYKVRVTGTRFNVCSYADNSYSTVTLAEGKVDIHLKNNKKAIDVEPGQQFKLDRDRRKYSLTETDVNATLSWKDGEFSFREVQFSDLVKRLERWYNVKLHYTAPELGEMKYSGRFRNQETIWQVLDALKLTTPIDYRKIGFREFQINYKPM